VFGARVVPINEVLNALPALLESKDAKARDKTKEIMVRPLGVPGRLCHAAHVA
jgi:hypothetical protein